MTWDPIVRNQCEILWANGKTFEEINILLNQVPAVTIRKWIRQIKTKGNLNTFKGAKKPPKFTERAVRALKIAAIQNKDETIAQIGERANFDGCHETIVKYLKKEGIESVVAAKVPLLNERQVIKRLQFVDLNDAKGLNYWKTWTFSDESSFWLDCSKGQRRIVIRRNERYLPRNVVGKKQGGGGKLMIWSHISWDGIGPLIFIEGGIDSNLYMEILNLTVLPHLLDRLDQTGVPQSFQDDGASCHDANDVIDFCAEKGINRPCWPPCSPDMNPIEYLWGWVNDKLTRLPHKPQNIEELKEKLIELWGEITVDQVRNLYRGMPGRLESLRRARGWNTHH